MPNNSTIALSLSRVSARHEDEADRRAFTLKDISFEVSKGSFVSIAGPSGAGKTTLMRVILGLMKPASGTVTRNFSRPAMVFQNYALFPWLTALENAAFGLTMRGMQKDARERIAHEKLLEVGLGDLSHRYPNELSGGQRQRVGLARALAIEPDFLIMDEPFSSLDTITAEALKKDLLSLWQKYGLTVLMVNHLIPDAIELSDQVLIMRAHPGEIKDTLTIDLPRPRDAREPAFFSYVDKLTGLIRNVS